jgi:hypothetical protein
VGEGMKSCTNVTSADLSRKGIAFDGCCLEGLGRASDAEGNWIGDEGSRAVGERMMGCTNMTSLDLTRNDGTSCSRVEERESIFSLMWCRC